MKKLEDYKRNAEKPEVVKDLKKALLKKIATEKEKMERELFTKKTTMRTKMKEAMQLKLKKYEEEIREVEEAFPSPSNTRGSARFFSKS